METRIEERMLEEAGYVLKNGATVRETGAVLGVSKSTVHHDLTARLPKRYPALYRRVELVLQHNKAERHLRGGEATKRKYGRLSAKPDAAR